MKLQSFFSQLEKTRISTLLQTSNLFTSLPRYLSQYCQITIRVFAVTADRMVKKTVRKYKALNRALILNREL